MSDVLTRERTETNERVAKLNKQTELEGLQKEVIECECELTKLSRPSIWKWVKKLF